MDSVKSTNSIYGVLSIGIVVLGFAAFLFWLVGLKSDEKSELISTGIEAKGVITEKACGDHGSVYYSFSANGETYTRKGYHCVKDCQKVKIGDAVNIKYLEKNPSINECGEIHKAKASVNGFYAFILFFVVAFIVFLFKVFRGVNSEAQ